MPKSTNQRLKLLYLYDIFTTETDEEHHLTIPQLIEKLAKRGVEAERKTLYEDLEALRTFGLDVIKVRNKSRTFYFTNRCAFELPELRLLIDAVQASRSLTAKKTNELIEKLKSLPSRYEGAALIKQVYTSRRPKAENESIYYTINDIHTAIEQNRKICFCYFDWSCKKQKVLRHGGAENVVSPFALIWDDEHYYMPAFDSSVGIVKHYRVDRMVNVKIHTQERDGQELLKSFDPARYTSKVFGMFGGEEQPVTLRFEERLAGAMLDRFGMDINMFGMQNGLAEITISAVVSPQFYSWVLGFEGMVEIVSPPTARRDFSALCKKLALMHV